MSQPSSSNVASADSRIAIREASLGWVSSRAIRREGPFLLSTASSLGAKSRSKLARYSPVFTSTTLPSNSAILARRVPMRSWVRLPSADGSGSLKGTSRPGMHEANHRKGQRPIVASLPGENLNSGPAPQAGRAKRMRESGRGPGGKPDLLGFLVAAGIAAAALHPRAAPVMAQEGNARGRRPGSEAVHAAVSSSSAVCSRASG